MIVKLGSGKEYEVEAVSDTLVNLAKEAVRNEFLAKGEPIDPPTYKVTTAGGGVSEEPHDETTLSTDEERAAWTAYIEANKRLEIAVNQRTMKVWLMGLKVELPEDKKWIETQEWLGITVPENPIDRRYHYVTTEILKSPDDLFTTLNAIMKESYRGMVKPEDLDAAIETFRDKLQGQAAVKFAPKEGPLVAQSKTEHP